MDYLDKLFFFGCIPTRLLYAVVINKYPMLWWVNLIIAVYFMYAFISWDGRKGFFGGKLWWNNMRFVHSIIFFMAIWWPMLLYVDVILGIVARGYHILKTR